MEPAPLGESWQRVERWVVERGRAPELAPAATPADIARTEEQLGTGLHPDHALLLLGHNGSDSCCLPPCYEILGTDEVVTAWRTRTRVWGDGWPLAYAPSWIPFASDGAGGVLHLDVSRPHERIHEHDKPGASHLSSHPMRGSLPALLHYTADAMETGRHLDGYRRPGDDDPFLLRED
jgi:cell wall assembly regulator SMI1